MIITYHGLECFKFQFGNVVVATNPPTKDSQAVAKPPRFGADIVLESLQHPDFAGGEHMSYGEKKPFVVRGPGEYEIQDIIVRGFHTVSHYGGMERINTLYSLFFEGMHIVFAGALDEKELSQEILELLDSIDIMFVPIGGVSSSADKGGVLDASSAYKLAVKHEPRLIIPMHYDGERGTALKTFLEEGGQEQSTAEEKLTVKRKDLETSEGDIVVLALQ